jgi:hypothetical protein
MKVLGFPSVAKATPHLVGLMAGLKSRPNKASLLNICTSKALLLKVMAGLKSRPNKAFAVNNY